MIVMIVMGRARRLLTVTIATVVTIDDVPLVEPSDDSCS
jgi:hypothetical protein